MSTSDRQREGCWAPHLIYVSTYMSAPSCSSRNMARCHDKGRADRRLYWDFSQRLSRSQSRWSFYQRDDFQGLAHIRTVGMKKRLGADTILEASWIFLEQSGTVRWTNSFVKFVELLLRGIWLFITKGGFVTAMQVRRSGLIWKHSTISVNFWRLQYVEIDYCILLALIFKNVSPPSLFILQTAENDYWNCLY